MSVGKLVGLKLILQRNLMRLNVRPVIMKQHVLLRRLSTQKHTFQALLVQMDRVVCSLGATAVLTSNSKDPVTPTELS